MGVGGVERLRTVWGGSRVSRRVSRVAKGSIILGGINGAAGVQRLFGGGSRWIDRRRGQGT